jgi:hypothetical protein
MHSESYTVGAEQVSQDTLEAICKLTLSGSTLEAISCVLDLNVQTVSQIIARGVFGSKDFDQEVSQCQDSSRAPNAPSTFRCPNLHLQLRGSH